MKLKLTKEGKSEGFAPFLFEFAKTRAGLASEKT